MTEDESAPPAAPGPTPTEISARLEALLKRTHALRLAQTPNDPEGPMWPPSDTDLAAVEVIDVPPSSRPTPAPAAAAATGSSRLQAPAEPGAASRDADTRDTNLQDGDATSQFGRPDWSTLRMRDTPIEEPRTPGWVWPLVALLAIALGLETAYLVRAAPWAVAADDGSPAAATVIRVEGPPGLEVSLDGTTGAHALPFELTLDQGQSAPRLIIAATPPADAVTPPADTPTSAPGSDAVSAAPVPDTAPAAAVPNATTGAVRIESTPAGAIVTMGGRERGPTPIVIEDLRPGRHEVLVVSAAGSRLFHVDVTAGVTARLDAVLGSGQP